MTAGRLDAIGVLLTGLVGGDDLDSTRSGLVRDGRQLGCRIGRSAWTLDDHGRADVGLVGLVRLLGGRRLTAITGEARNKPEL
jgi:hypothetical protein